jgi:hypothetical protein
MNNHARRVRPACEPPSRRRYLWLLAPLVVVLAGAWWQRGAAPGADDRWLASDPRAPGEAHLERAQAQELREAVLAVARANAAPALEHLAESHVAPDEADDEGTELAATGDPVAAAASLDSRDMAPGTSSGSPPAHLRHWVDLSR